MTVAVASASRSSSCCRRKSLASEAKGVEGRAHGWMRVDMRGAQPRAQQAHAIMHPALPLPSVDLRRAAQDGDHVALQLAQQVTLQAAPVHGQDDLINQRRDGAARSDRKGVVEEDDRVEHHRIGRREQRDQEDRETLGEKGEAGAVEAAAPKASGGASHMASKAKLSICGRTQSK